MSGRATARARVEPTVVIDIGGGSTEFIVGAGSTAGFHVSLHAGVVRMSERHIHSDPPAPEELQELAADVRRVFPPGLPSRSARRSRADRRRRHRHLGGGDRPGARPLRPRARARLPLLLATVELLLARLADMDEAQRRAVVGLHPDRAPTIVAGMILLARRCARSTSTRSRSPSTTSCYGGALRCRLAGVA